MSFIKNLKCFKAYDIRGKLDEELDEDIAYRIGRATAQSRNAKTVVVGFDARVTSPDLASAVAKGICDAGADVLQIGLAGTEEVYAAVSEFDTCAGIEVTASHNPIDYNGMKLLGVVHNPYGKNLGILNLAEENNFFQPQQKGTVLDKKEVAAQLTLKKY